MIEIVKDSEKTLSRGIIDLHLEASNFLLSHTWCKKVIKSWYAKGWEDLLCVFYFEILPNSKDVDNFVWIIVGDIPPAYIDIESAKNEKQAIDCYVNIMQDWVDAVNNNKDMRDVYPVSVTADKKHANMLQKRLDFIKNEFLSEMK